MVFVWDDLARCGESCRVTRVSSRARLVAPESQDCLEHSDRIFCIIWMLVRLAHKRLDEQMHRHTSIQVSVWRISRDRSKRARRSSTACITGSPQPKTCISRKSTIECLTAHWNTVVVPKLPSGIVHFVHKRCSGLAGLLKRTISVSCAWL